MMQISVAQNNRNFVAVATRIHGFVTSQECLRHAVCSH